MHSLALPILSYPRILKLSEVPELKNKYVYIIKKHDLNGTAMTFKKEKDGALIKFGDWNGLDVEKSMSDEFLSKSAKIIATIDAMKVSQIQLYASNGRLVDARLNGWNFASPGMIDDTFGRVIKTQEIIGKPVVLDDKIINQIKSKNSPYNEPVVIKPCVFKTIVRGKEVLPMYATVN